MRSIFVVLMVAAAFTPADAQCQFYLASQIGGNQGFALHLEAPADSKDACQLNSVSLVLTMGDGSAPDAGKFSSARRNLGNR